MKILVIGSGGREHAITRKLLTSPTCTFVAAAPGSDAMKLDGVECIDIFAHTDIAEYCRKQAIDLVVIGPEEPLVHGLADRLRDEGFPTFGPSEAGAQIEASKHFTKQLCKTYKIPTAASATFTDLAEAKAYVTKKGAPIVIKADGLAAGKGVTVAMNVNAALKALTECFDGAFGEAGHRVVIEEYLEGEEVSFFALCDGNKAVSFTNAQDHKRAFDNDKGPNTGGMGTFSPTPLVDTAMEERIMHTIIRPTFDGLKKELINYVGVLFAGLMLTKSGPKLIEYNCRFGDPETQSMLARFTGDLALLLMSCAQGNIDETQLQFSADAAVCVVLASAGYPGKYKKNTLIQNLHAATNVPKTAIFHAGTMHSGGEWLSRGGRVLNVVATGSSIRTARYTAYEAVDIIDWPEGFCRRDIAARVVKAS